MHIWSSPLLRLNAYLVSNEIVITSISSPHHDRISQTDIESIFGPPGICVLVAIPLISLHWSLKLYWPESFTSMSSQIARMESASAKIIWRTILFKSLTIDFISPWTFDQIHIIWAMSVTCSKSWTTCCRTITPCCPIRTISYAISTRLCWTLKLLITFKVFNF